MRQAIALRLLFAAVDLLGLMVAFGAAYLLRVHVLESNAVFSGQHLLPYLQLFALIAVLWLVASVEARILGLHELPYEVELVRIIRGLFFILLAVLLLLSMLKMTYEYSRLVVFGGFALSAVVVSLNRVLLRAALSKRDGLKQRVLLVCSTPQLPQGVSRHLRLRARQHAMVGVVMPREVLGERAELVIGELVLPVLGDLSQLDTIVARHQIQQSDIVLHGFAPRELNELAGVLEGRIPFMTLHPDPEDMLVASFEPMVQAGAINVHLHQELVDPFNRFAKRVFDILFSSTVLVLLSPLYALLALSIKLDSSGPIFYAQRRLGQDGRHFHCLKFRTMQVDAAERLEALLASDPAARAEWAADHKLKLDPRVTRLGDFLRKSSLDELPQFVNVLKGEMSVVGPRPIVDDEVAKYHDFSSLLFRVKPGVTGLWQVSGRNDVTYDERVDFDRFYVKNWSFRLDTSIIIKTLFTVFARRGAY